VWLKTTKSHGRNPDTKQREIWTATTLIWHYGVSGLP